MQLEDMSTAELIALVKRQEQELAGQPVQQPAPVGRVWECREDHFLYAKLDDGVAGSGAVKLGDLLYTAAPVAVPVDVPAASVQPESAPEYKEITGHNGRITGYVLSNADKMPSYSQPESGRDVARRLLENSNESATTGDITICRQDYADLCASLGIVLPDDFAVYPANVAQVGELNLDLIERTVERLNRAQIFPLASEWSAILAAAKKGPTT